MLTTLSGVQAYFYFSEFRRKGAQGHAVRKRTHSRDDSSHARVYRVCYHSGKLTHTLLLLMSLTLRGVSGRSVSRCRRRPSFLGQILSRTRSGFTTRSSTSSKTLKRNRRSTSYLRGGTGALLALLPEHF
jgi:hypothetical protein